MRSKIKKELCMLFIATILFSALATIGSVHAINPTSIDVVPASIVDTSMAPGSSFIINSTVAYVTDLYTWQVRIDFDPAVLACTNATIPSDNVFAGKSVIPVTPFIDNVTGFVGLGVSLIGAGSGFTGSGVLCQLGFVVLSRGHTGLDYSTPYGSDTFLLDSNLNVIPSLVNNGYFDNRLAEPQPPVAVFDYSPKPVLVNTTVTFNGSASYDPDGTVVSWAWNFGDSGSGSGMVTTHSYLAAGNFTATLNVTDNDGQSNSTSMVVTVYEFQPARLYVDPAEIIDPSLFPPTVITVNVTVNYVTNMYDYAFNLSYNTEMLTCIGAIINRVQNQTNFTPLILIDDGAGFIWVNVTYHSPAVPISTVTPLALVTVYFQIDAVGSSILHLSNTELSDPLHQNMTHVTEDGFVMTLIRDVEITEVVPSTSWAYQGWPVSVQVTARNNGNVSETFAVAAYYDNATIGTIPVVNLASNTDTVLTFGWNTSVVAEGTYTISAQASAVPFEFNTTNNYLADGQVEIFTQIRDVAITNVTTSGAWAYQGVAMNVTVTARNVGDVNESFNVMAFCDAALIGNVSVVDLAPGVEVVEVFTLNTTDLSPCSNYTISGQASMVPFEFNTTNNLFVDGVITIRFIGDLNGDGKVDMRDVAVAAAAFGTHAGDPRWNPDADITGTDYLVPDGVVDMRDVALIAKNFGKSC
jgi:hypothetical protein